MVHELGNSQEREVGGVSRLGEGAPGSPPEHAGLEGGGAGQVQGLAVPRRGRGHRPPLEPRVASIGGEVDCSGLGVQADLQSAAGGGDGAAVRLEHRRGDFGDQVAACELGQVDVPAAREVGIEEPVLVGDVVLVAVEEVVLVPGAGALQHVAAEISPAGGFGHDGTPDLVAPREPSREDLVRHQRPAVVEVLVDPVGEAQAEFGIGSQGAIEPCGLVVVVEPGAVAAEDDVEIGLRRRRVVLVARDDELGVPAEELVAGASCSPAAGVPIVPIPVIVAEVEVEEHIVDEIVDVEQLANPGVAGRRGDSRVGDVHHPVPVREVAVDGGGDVLGVVIFTLPISVGSHEGGRGALVEVVETPVETVEVEVDEAPVG